MKTNRKLFGMLTLILFFALFTPERAEAYLDPGTGSFIFQMVLAAILAAAVTIKLWWKKLVMFVAGFFSRPVKKETDDE